MIRLGPIGGRALEGRRLEGNVWLLWPQIPMVSLTCYPTETCPPVFIPPVDLTLCDISVHLINGVWETEQLRRSTFPLHVYLGCPFSFRQHMYVISGLQAGQDSNTHSLTLYCVPASLLHISQKLTHFSAQQPYEGELILLLFSRWGNCGIGVPSLLDSTWGPRYHLAYILQQWVFRASPISGLVRGNGGAPQKKSSRVGMKDNSQFCVCARRSYCTGSILFPCHFLQCFFLSSNYPFYPGWV